MNFREIYEQLYRSRRCCSKSQIVNTFKVRWFSTAAVACREPLSCIRALKTDRDSYHGRIALKFGNVVEDHEPAVHAKLRIFPFIDVAKKLEVSHYRASASSTPFPPQRPIQFTSMSFHSSLHCSREARFQLAAPPPRSLISQLSPLPFHFLSSLLHTYLLGNSLAHELGVGSTTPALHIAA